MGLNARIKKLFSGGYSFIEFMYRIYQHKNIPQFYKNIENNQKNNTPLKRVTAIAYDGLSQNTHPSVLFNGGKYVLAASPFPFSDALKENPCIYTSDDGIVFSIKENQPLALPSKNAYLSDPEICLNDNIFSLYYRETLCDTKRTRIYKRCSENLESWSNPKTVIDTEKSFLSPSAVRFNDTDYIYAVNIESDGSVLCRYIEREDKIQYEGEALIVNGLPEGKFLWHIDIEIIKGKFVALFTLSQDKNGNNSKLYLATGNDDGTVWTIQNKIDLCSNENKYFKNIYKSSIIDVNGTAKIYVSAMNNKRAWHIYTIDLTEDLL